MKVDPKRIRSLREAKAWSQDRLAQISGVSLRTIQRVEADGAASAETRMAIASALGIPVNELGVGVASETYSRRLAIVLCLLGAVISAMSACSLFFSGTHRASPFGMGFADGFIVFGVGIMLAIIAILSSRYSRPKRTD